MKSTRSGFTLTELLVVIGIIAVLAALITPAVLNARSAARNAAIKVEIDMLHMAIMNYKNEYGSFPPLVSGSITGSDAASRHLLRVSPRVTSAAAQAVRLCYLNTGSVSLSGSNAVNQTNALPFWLFGYTGDPTSPVFSVTASGTAARKKLYDFDASRISNIGTGSATYFPSGKSGSPYLYFDSASYTRLPYAGGSSSTAGALRQSFLGEAAASLFATGTSPFFNADTFQILSAGVDQIFGTDDDLANFWTGTRRQYLDSLQNQ